MNSLLKILFCTITLCSVCYTVNAAHLVGGDISYTCLGNNEYEIKLRVYRDCGGGGAQFDANAVISIYDGDNNFIRTLNVPKGPTVSISPNPTNDPCITVPAGLCTEYAEYVVSTSLPPSPLGYVISHQRCCRNNFITNVPNSGDWGNTYTTQVPPNDTSCNSTPEIQNIAPTVICVGNNLNLPVQVNEIDGDSLYFEFCDILHGGGQVGGNGCDGIIPNPACPPPYKIVPFDPPYTAQNPLPASPAIAINPQTGVITGKPNQVGQYVVGVCISEYRNGQKLSTVRLDYQFNIANCGQPIAAMVTPAMDPTVLCNGLTVSFTSLSTGANAQEWIFGMPPLGTSTDVNPTFTFPSLGLYPVTLIVNPGQSCTDSVTYYFNVTNNVDVELKYTGIPCFEVQGLEFYPIGVFPANATFSWNFGALANLSSVNLPNTPPITWSQPGKHPVSLTLNWAACSKTFWDTVEISSLSLSVSAGQDQAVYEGEQVQLSGSGGVGYQWAATNPASFNDRNIFNPITIPRYDSTIYYVFVTDEFGCTGVDSLLVYYLFIESDEVMNVITPNGDGRNDVLDLGNVLDDDPCRFYVMDRWGREVYQQEIYDNNWNGVSSGGQDLPDGTYYFIVQYKDQIRYKGPVTIIRNQ